MIPAPAARLLLAAAFIIPAAPLAAGKDRHPVMESARARITAFHKGQPDNGALLRVVYFHPSDREPLAAHRARVDRIMADISRFYREEMAGRFSVEGAGLPLELRDGKAVIHEVCGQHPASNYDYQSGDAIWQEVKSALAGTIKPEREHVLLLHGLCENDEGVHVFHAPYYGAGWSDHRRGLCHAADCEKLDPQLLTATEQPFVFKEHYYERQEMSVAKFNTWYLGGIAHELGHGLGFPHDNGGPGEAAGISLMGGGNLHYREDLWGGKEPAYLALATALRLAAHPLITRSDKARWQAADASIDLVSARASTSGMIRLTGRVRAGVPVCALIASTWPTDARTDHGAMTFCAAVGDDGQFEVELTHLEKPCWNLKLGALQVNGAESTGFLTIHCEQGRPDATRLLAEWRLKAAESAFMADTEQFKKLTDPVTLATLPDGETKQHLEHLRSLAEPAVAPMDLVTTPAASAALSDARWSHAEVGWGRVVRNQFAFDPARREGVFLRLGGRIIHKGLYAHSASRFAFPLGGGWKTFQVSCGLQDGTPSQGSAMFKIIADGREIHSTEALRPGTSTTLNLDITGVQSLELRTQSGQAHNHNSQAIWAEPTVTR